VHDATITSALFALIPAFIALSAGFAAYGFALGLRWWSRRTRTRNPLTRDLLRSPGQSLREEVDDLSFDISSDVTLMILLPSFIVLTFLFLARLATRPLGLLALGVILVVIHGFIGTTVARKWRRRQHLRLGVDGEMATGEELNLLMLRGCRVFHDFPAEKFNIDHIVVGPGGVFAVETKARAKPNRGRGRDDATVIYDGSVLRFPGWSDREALHQAVRQAAWLGKWLTSAVGEAVDVKPAVALPGWFVDRKSSAGPTVFNPRNAGFMAEPHGTNPLAAQLIQRITHQLEQRCRDVKPLAYRDVATEKSPSPAAT
jgi:hypothetical protein